MTEIWKKIKYNSRYEVSNFGNIRNAKTKQLLALNPTKSHRHPQVFLSRGKWKEQRTVSHIVWEHFAPWDDRQYRYYQIAHLDNNIFNNNIKNLAALL